MEKTDTKFCLFVFVNDIGAHVQFWGIGELKSLSNQLSEHIFETEPFGKLIIAPKLDMSL